MRKYLPDESWFIGKNIPKQPDYKIVEYKAPGCNAHVFRAHSDAVNNDIACKIIPKQNLIKDIWHDEIDKANALRSDIVVKFWDVSEWVVKQDNIDCVVLCSEYVYGECTVSDPFEEKIKIICVDRGS